MTPLPDSTCRIWTQVLVCIAVAGSITVLESNVSTPLFSMRRIGAWYYSVSISEDGVVLPTRDAE